MRSLHAGAPPDLLALHQRPVLRRVRLQRRRSGPRACPAPAPPPAGTLSRTRAGGTGQKRSNVEQAGASLQLRSGELGGELFVAPSERRILLRHLCAGGRERALSRWRVQTRRSAADACRCGVLRAVRARA